MEMECSVEEVSAVTSYYYKTLRSTLSGLTEPTVHVHNLGNFYIKENALDKNMDISLNYLSKLSTTDIAEYGMRRDIKNNYEKMSLIKNKLDLERMRRRSVINKRYNNEPEKEYNINLEK
jgi:hypothetical protein